MDLSNATNRKGQYNCALHSLHDANDLRLQISKQMYDEDHQKWAKIYRNITMIYFKEERYSDALDYQKRVLHIQRKDLHENHHLFGLSHNNNC